MESAHKKKMRNYNAQLVKRSFEGYKNKNPLEKSKLS